MFTLNRKCIALLISLHTASSLAMVSHELFPEAGPIKGAFPFEYSSVTDDEKIRLKRIDLGCMAVLKDEGDCALVGPISPCQVAVLHNGGKTVVGHLCVNANQQSFIDYAKTKFSGCNFAQTVGTLCTVHDKGYEEPCDTVGGVPLSFKQVYQGRTQLEELKVIKDAFVEPFGIKDRKQINASLFNCTLSEPDAYDLAKKYVFIKHQVGCRPLIYSTCPLEENLFGDFRSISLKERQESYAILKRIDIMGNPFFIQQINSKQKSSAYGAYPMIEVGQEVLL